MTEPELKDLIAQLIVNSKDKRYYLAEKRIRVIALLHQWDKFLDAEQILLRLRNHDMKVSISSVYLILKWLEQNGLVCRKLSEETSTNIYKFHKRLN